MYFNVLKQVSEKIIETFFTFDMIQNTMNSNLLTELKDSALLYGQDIRTKIKENTCVKRPTFKSALEHFQSQLKNN